MRRLLSGLAILAVLSSAGCARTNPDLAQTYAAVEQLYRSEAKFRTDYAPDDAPVDPQTVASNFLRIAFQTEPQMMGDEAVVIGEEIALARWDRDIGYALYGALPEDRAHLDRLTARLSLLTGRRIGEESGPDAAQIKLLVIPESERAVLMRELVASEPSPLLDFLHLWSVHPAYPCIGSIATQPETGRIDFGIILIKAELTGDFRRACLTEEFVQTLGLVNDDPAVRPSIFNDDQEFIDLTQHDEYLLRILYDDRLRSGMSRDEARPLVEAIALELTRAGPDALPQTY